MPAKDIYHETVKNALVKDGWAITYDPLFMRVGKKDMYVDLGAWGLVGADKAGRKIAVEIKSFASLSVMNDLERAMGQYMVYKVVLARREPDRTLHLAISRDAYEDAFDDELGKMLQDEYHVPLIIFDVEQEVVLRWIP